MNNLFGDQPDFNSPYYLNQLITYLGNKRSLLPFINTGIENIKNNLNKKQLTMLDGFAGSGVVSRLMKFHADILHSNDLESYSYIVNKCYLANKSSLDIDYIQNTIKNLNKIKHNQLIKGFIATNYAPEDDNNIKL